MSQGYTYNAIAEHPIIPEFDDNEIKYKWNGALLNLSDLPVSDYTKTIYNIAGSVTSETEVITNTLSVSLQNTGETYELVVNAQYAPEKDITVKVKVEGEESPVSVLISAGATSASQSTSIPSSSPRPGLSNASVSPSKDGTYTYQVAIEQVITDKFKAYYGQFYESDLNDMASLIPGMRAEMVDSAGTDMTFTIPAVDFTYTSTTQMEEFKYGLVLALPQSVYDADQYFLSEQSTPGVKEEGFIFKESQVIDSVEYAILCRTDEGWVFVPNDAESGGGDAEYVFNIKYVK